MELLVIAAVALIVFGPEKLPVVARQVGRYAAEIRRMASEVRDEFEAGLSLEEDEGETYAVPEESFEPPDDDAEEAVTATPVERDETEH